IAPAAAPTPVPMSAPLPAPYPVPYPTAAPVPAPTAAPVAVPQPVRVSATIQRPRNHCVCLFTMTPLLLSLALGTLPVSLQAKQVPLEVTMGSLGEWTR